MKASMFCKPGLTFQAHINNFDKELICTKDGFDYFIQPGRVQTDRFIILTARAGYDNPSNYYTNISCFGYPREVAIARCKSGKSANGEIYEGVM
jgi:hypothetical protein